MCTYSGYVNAALVLLASSMALATRCAATAADTKAVQKCKRMEGGDRTALQKYSFCFSPINSTDKTALYSSDTGAFTIDIKQIGEGADAQSILTLTNHDKQMNPILHMTSATKALYEFKLDQSNDPPPNPDDNAPETGDDGFYYLTGIGSCRYTTPKGFSRKTISDLHVWTT